MPNDHEVFSVCPTCSNGEGESLCGSIFRGLKWYFYTRIVDSIKLRGIYLSTGFDLYWKRGLE